MKEGQVFSERLQHNDSALGVMSQGRFHNKASRPSSAMWHQADHLTTRDFRFLTCELQGMSPTSEDGCEMKQGNKCKAHRGPRSLGNQGLWSYHRGPGEHRSKISLTIWVIMSLHRETGVEMQHVVINLWPLLLGNFFATCFKGSIPSSMSLGLEKYVTQENVFHMIRSLVTVINFRKSAWLIIGEEKKIKAIVE